MEKGLIILMPADLHCHTLRSDGTITPTELVTLAKSVGLSAVAVTDHDTFVGVQEAQAAGEKTGIEVIAGAEISCYDYSHSRRIHLLCYMPSSPEVIEPMIDSTNELRRRAVTAAVYRVIEEYPLPEDMIFDRAAESRCIYKQHIMSALIDAGYAGEMFGPVFKRLFGQGGIAPTHHSYPDVFEALALIHKAGGVAVLAHPAVYDSYDIIPKLIHGGLDGIEINYPRAKPTDLKDLSAVCDRHGLIKTGGTDFHGRNNKLPLRLGTCTTDDEQLEKLKELAASRK